MFLPHPALLSYTTDPLCRARLLAAYNKESDLYDFISMGLRTDNLTIRIAISIRLGVATITIVVLM